MGEATLGAARRRKTRRGGLLVARRDGGPQGERFERIASFSVYTNNADPAASTVAEIVSVSDDGKTLVYTDSPLQQIGFVDIEDPAAPQPAGTLAMGGEPTSVAV